MIKKIINEYTNRFESRPTVIRSPGRVNLIGEHTDYNDGFVLPAAIDRSMIVAMAPNGGHTCRVFSADMNEGYQFKLSEPFKKNHTPWTHYILGVVDQLQRNDYNIEGFDCVFGGNVPIGAGLSSSAALEGGIIFGLSTIFGLAIPKRRMAQLGQQAENEFVGVQCGIMDHFVNIFGEAEYALKLDCRSLEYQRIPLKWDDMDIVLCDTGIRRELASSEYNIRRSQCEQGVQVMKRRSPSVQHLRDADHALLAACKGDMSAIVYKRCKFIIEENERVHAACDDLLSGNIRAFGRRMFQSHYGLRDKYEVSCTELDALVAIAENHQGVLGSRMMGGGFGGCTINLVEKEHTDSFIAQTKKEYKVHTNEPVTIYCATVDTGTHKVSSVEAEAHAK